MLRIKLKQEGGVQQPQPQYKGFKEKEEEEEEEAEVRLLRRPGLPHVSAAACGVGSVSGRGSAKLNILGHPVRRRNGDKVHICFRCNFPIAIYGRLDPCDHIFCLTCAKKDPHCFLCDEKISRVRKFEMLDGVYVCGASRCLKSFVDKMDFELHVKNAHKELLQQQVTETAPQVESAARPQLIKHGSTPPPPPPFERQSRQQQFRNAQQQRQLQHQHEHQLKPKAHNKGGPSASLPHPYPHPYPFAFSAYPDYTTQDAHNFYAKPDVSRFQNASPSQPPGFV